MSAAGTSEPGTDKHQKAVGTQTPNGMILNRPAPPLNLETAWQTLENQPASPDVGLLLEQHVQQCGAANLYLGLVAATGERAFWLKTPGRPHRQPTDRFSNTLWVKTIEYADYSLLTVVLADPAVTPAFTDLAHDLLESLSRQPTIPAARQLFQILKRWQPQFAELACYAA
ncbi:PD-(D/E)XK motif protein [Hymenobacter mucosus]|uniref:Putative PD-(D/E)XK family member n=1 Tax=Hymenobacter mucosus TaxID=1411120 RepID=A0A238X3G7_9BACT|nr:PD-(D/E)XK motif protein [Hymenobacter mucosus]SNR52924.1 Putative PD-(D/E)XK family member [Hymenobacter mucosus]